MASLANLGFLRRTMSFMETLTIKIAFFAWDWMNLTAFSRLKPAKQPFFIVFSQKQAHERRN
jgi:hypothetical protein